MPGKKKLPAKQAAFVREYLVDRNATAAAKRAGYSDPNYGRQLLTNPNVAAAIKKAEAAAAEEARIKVQDVLQGLHREATFDGEGSSHSARVAAWAHLGKHLGMFTDRVDVTSGGEKLKALTTERERLADLTPAQLAALYRDNLT